MATEARGIKSILVMDQQTPNQRLRLIRELLHLNQTQFSKALGFKQSHISAIESEKKEVSVKIIYALVNHFKVSANWLLSGEGEMFLAHHDQSAYPAAGKNEILSPDKEGGSPQANPQKFSFDERELASRIQELEAAILEEGYLPLYHLCELFSLLLKTPVDFSSLQKLPLPASSLNPPDPLSPVMSALDLEVFENKVFYFSQLEQTFVAWKKEFHQQFDKFYAYLTHPENHTAEIEILRGPSASAAPEL